MPDLPPLKALAFDAEIMRLGSRYENYLRDAMERKRGKRWRRR